MQQKGSALALYSEARAMAWTVLFKDGVGLSAWPWYRAALPRMLEEIGRSDMLHDATQEILRLIDVGHDRFDVMRLTEAYLRGLWRARYDASSAVFEPPTVHVDDVELVPSSGEGKVSEEAREVLLLVRSATTDEQWRMLEAYADSGSLRDAAEACGVSHETVRRALVRARDVTVPVYRGRSPRRGTARATARDLAGGQALAATTAIATREGRNDDEV